MSIFQIYEKLIYNRVILLQFDAKESQRILIFFIVCNPGSCLFTIHPANDSFWNAIWLFELHSDEETQQNIPFIFVIFYLSKWERTSCTHTWSWRSISKCTFLEFLQINFVGKIESKSPITTYFGNVSLFTLCEWKCVGNGFFLLFY